MNEAKAAVAAAGSVASAAITISDLSLFIDMSAGVVAIIAGLYAIRFYRRRLRRRR